MEDDTEDQIISVESHISMSNNDVSTPPNKQEPNPQTTNSLSLPLQQDANKAGMSPNRVKLNIAEEDNTITFNAFGAEEQKSSETTLKAKPKPFLKSKGVTFTGDKPNNLVPAVDGHTKIRKLSTQQK